MHHLFTLMKMHPGPVGIGIVIEVISTTITWQFPFHLAGEVCFN